MIMKKLFLLFPLLLFFFDTFSRDWDPRSFIESKMAVMDERQKELDARGIYIRDLTDFLDPICLVLAPHIGFDPHTQRMSYSDFKKLKLWVKDHLEIISSSLYNEAYYASIIFTRCAFSQNIPLNSAFEIIPYEILCEDIERRISGDTTEYYYKDSTEILDFLYHDNSIYINSDVSNYIYQIVMNDSSAIDALCNKIANYEEEDRVLITRKIFVYFFFSFFGNQPLDVKFNIEKLEGFWYLFNSYPWKDWILHNNRKYYINFLEIT